MRGARERAGLQRATCHQLRHTCLTRLREAGMALEAVHSPRPATSRRVDPHLSAPDQRLARPVNTRRASELIDAGHAAELLALEAINS